MQGLEQSARLHGSKILTHNLNFNVLYNILLHVLQVGEKSIYTDIIVLR